MHSSEEAPENGKESPLSAHANGMNEFFGNALQNTILVIQALSRRVVTPYVELSRQC
jgi:hypothetical protein